MRFDILRPIADLLLLLPDGTVPIDQVFRLASRDAKTKRPYKQFLYAHAAIKTGRFEKGRYGDTLNVCGEAYVSMVVPATDTIRDPGGHCDVSVWENYGIATYWGYSAHTGAPSPYDDQYDQHKIYKYLDSIGFIKIQYHNHPKRNG